jgi:hypothetical protein
VKIRKSGYVDVGRVVEVVQTAKDFKVATPEGERPALEVLQDAERYRKHADDSDMSEYFVRVNWLGTIPESKAVDEVGLFGNQNTACQPTAQKWRHTVERLKALLYKMEPGWLNDPACV